MKDTKQRLSVESESVLKEGIALVLSEWWVFDEGAKEYKGDGDTRQIVDQIHSQIFFWFTRSTGKFKIFLSSPLGMRFLCHWQDCSF